MIDRKIARIFALALVAFGLAPGAISISRAQFEQSSQIFKQGCADLVAGLTSTRTWYCVGVVTTLADLNQMGHLNPKICKQNGISYRDIANAIVVNSYKFPDYIRRR
jgi:hypothetical protein